MLVEANQLTKTYSSGERRLEVLRGADIVVQPGEMVAIVGSSGTGKSTLLHVLGTLDTPDSGSLHFDGEDVLTLGENSRTRLRNEKIGFVFQFHHLLPEFTALENVAMPLWIARESRERAEAKSAELLSALGLSERCEHRPSQLSGGEQQRVAVARALVRGPSLLLADEPTGNLDSRRSRELVDVMRSLHESHRLTSIIVTHSEVVASVCDRVIQMEDGRLQAPSERGLSPSQ